MDARRLLWALSGSVRLFTSQSYSFRVLSWNILAPRLWSADPPSPFPSTSSSSSSSSFPSTASFSSSSSSSSFPSTASFSSSSSAFNTNKVLDWKYRSTLIRDYLLEQEADIVCLQEVQMGDCWRQLYEGSSLQDMYDCIIQEAKETKHGERVAAVVLLRKASQWHVNSKESRSRALIVGLTHPSHPNKALILANVHFVAGANQKRRDLRYMQVQSLLKRMILLGQRLDLQLDNSEKSDPMRKTQKDNCTNNHQHGGEIQHAAVIIGDWNMNRGSLMYKLLTTGSLPYSEIERLSESFKKVQFPLPLLPLVDSFNVFQSMSKNRATKTITSSKESSIPLENPLTCETFRGITTLDYVFVNDLIRIQSTWTQPPSSQSLRNPRTGFNWPDEYHPSDHLAIGVTLALD